MNEAVKRYRQTWFPDEGTCIDDPCLEELFEEPIDAQETDGETSRLVLVTAQDYGQSIALPHYKLKRPNVDYFQSDLNIHMFNVCDINRGRIKFSCTMKDPAVKMAILLIP